MKDKTIKLLFEEQQDLEYREKGDDCHQEEEKWHTAGKMQLVGKRKEVLGLSSGQDLLKGVEDLKIGTVG